MTDLPHGFEFGDGAFCVVTGAPEARDFAYIPGPPRIELGSGDRPQASLLDSDEAAVLSLQCVWDLEDGTAALRDEITTRYPEAQSVFPDIIEFDSVTGALQIDGDTVAGPKDSSGTKPYRVVLQETLGGAAKTALVAGFDGTPGKIVVRYTGTFTLNAAVKAGISGNVAPAFKVLVPPSGDEGKNKGDGGGWFGWGKKHDKPAPKPPVVDLDDCAAQVEALLGSGDLVLKVDADPNAPDALTEKLTAEVKTMAARDILQSIEQMGADAASITDYGIDHSQRGSDTQSYSVTRSADLGVWFAANNGRALVSMSPSSIPTPQ